MDHKLQKALYLILMSLGLAVIFNFLFFDKLFGISVLIFVVVLLGAVFLFAKYQNLVLQKIWWLVSLIVFFALMLGVRDNEFLSFLNVCATFGLLMLLGYQLAGTPVWLMRIRDYLTLMVFVPFRMLGSALSSISLVGQIHSSVSKRDVWLRVFKGVVMALPILIVFGLLFSQADLVFSQFIGGFINLSVSESTVQYLALLFFAFLASLSFLSYIFFPRQNSSAMVFEKSDLVVPSGRPVEMLVFLGLISALFLVFIVFQVTYLFGGDTNIFTTGFTYAEYARRGFWELLAVGILSLLILLASEKYAGFESKRDKLFLIPALVLIVEVGIVIFSAFSRLSLYIAAYGMTLLRFYVAGFIVLLFALFILLAIKFIKAKQERFFAFGAVLTIAAFLMVVNLVNPDAFIVESNTQQYNQTGKIDVYYLTDLSADGVPGAIELYKKLEGKDREDLRIFFENQKYDLQTNSGDWQSANLSRVRALRLLNEFEY